MASNTLIKVLKPNFFFKNTPAIGTSTTYNAVINPLLPDVAASLGYKLIPNCCRFILIHKNVPHNNPATIKSFLFFLSFSIIGVLFFNEEKISIGSNVIAPTTHLIALTEKGCKCSAAWSCATNAKPHTIEVINKIIKSKDLLSY